MNNTQKWLEAEKTIDTGIFNKHDIVIVKGQGSHVWDSEGNEYIDCVAGYGVANVGHCHPKVVKAIQDQAATLLSMPQTVPTSTRAEFFSKLIATLPAGLNKVFPCNSGTEANEAALKFAMMATGKKKFVATMRGFSGRTLGSVALTHDPKYREPFGPYGHEVVFIPYNDVAALEAAVDESVAAVFFEPVQGEGGVRPGTPEFLQAARNITEEKGVLLILDEIQTGMGRTGKMWAFEHFGVTPDIITMAKALAGGVPIGCAVMTEDVASKMPKGGHGNTFGGNPLSMAAGIAALEAMEEENLPAQAAETGAWFMDELRKIDSSKIKDVRGIGLMIGLELKEKSAPYINRLEHEYKVLTLMAGPTVIRFLPPLNISREDLTKVLEAVKEVLAWSPKEAVPA